MLNPFMLQELSIEVTKMILMILKAARQGIDTFTKGKPLSRLQQQPSKQALFNKYMYCASESEDKTRLEEVKYLPNISSKVKVAN